MGRIQAEWIQDLQSKSPDLHEELKEIMEDGLDVFNEGSSSWNIAEDKYLSCYPVFQKVNFRN